MPWKPKLGSPAKVAALRFFLMPAGIFASATNEGRANEISMQDMSEQGVRDAFTAQLGAMSSGATSSRCFVSSSPCARCQSASEG